MHSRMRKKEEEVSIAALTNEWSSVAKKYCSSLLLGNFQLGEMIAVVADHVAIGHEECCSKDRQDFCSRFPCIGLDNRWLIAGWFVVRCWLIRVLLTPQLTNENQSMNELTPHKSFLWWFCHCIEKATRFRNIDNEWINERSNVHSLNELSESRHFNEIV